MDSKHKKKQARKNGPPQLSWMVLQCEKQDTNKRQEATIEKQTNETTNKTTKRKQAL